MDTAETGRGTAVFAMAARQARWLLAALLLVGLIVAPKMVSLYTVYLLFTILVYTTIGQGWNLAAGYTGMVSLGHAAFLGLGAYTCAMLLIYLHLPLVVGIVAGGVVASVFSILVSPPLFRFRGIYFTIGTLVLAEALRLWMIAWSAAGGSKGLNFPQAALPDLEIFYYLALALAVLSICVVEWISRSKLGLGLRAIRDNEDVARNVGVNTYRSKLASVAASTFLTGMAGAAIGAQLGSIQPYSIFNVSWSVSMVNMVIIGGMGTLVGPIVGAVFVVVLATLLADYYAIQVIITGVILILVIRFAPLGIWGSARRLPWVSRVAAGLTSPIGGKS